MHVVLLTLLTAIAFGDEMQNKNLRLKRTSSLLLKALRELTAAVSTSGSSGSDGSSQASCTLPNSAPDGYTYVPTYTLNGWQPPTLSDCTSLNCENPSFNGISCASGHSGVIGITACTTNGNPVTLTGCDETAVARDIEFTDKTGLCFFSTKRVPGSVVPPYGEFVEDKTNLFNEGSGRGLEGYICEQGYFMKGYGKRYADPTDTSVWKLYPICCQFAPSSKMAGYEHKFWSSEANQGSPNY